MMYNYNYKQSQIKLEADCREMLITVLLFIETVCQSLEPDSRAE